MAATCDFTVASPTTHPVTIPISPVSQANTQPAASSASTTSSPDVATTTSAVPSLLVAGPNDTTPRKDGSTGTDQKLSPATKLKAIIGGLILLAVLVLLLTIGYARHTRPDDWEYWDEDDDGEGPDPATTSAAPSVPLLTAPVAAVAAGAALGAAAGPNESARTATSVDEPTQAFQPPGTRAAPITLGTDSLPIVTLEDLTRDDAATGTKAGADAAADLVTATGAVGATLKDPVVKDSVVKDSVVKDPVVKDPVVRDPVVRGPGKETVPAPDASSATVSPRAAMGAATGALAASSETVEPAASGATTSPSDPAGVDTDAAKPNPDLAMASGGEVTPPAKATVVSAPVPDTATSSSTPATKPAPATTASGVVIPEVPNLIPESLTAFPAASPADTKANPAD